MAEDKSGYDIPKDWVDVFGAETYCDGEIQQAKNNDALREKISEEWKNPNRLVDYLQLTKEYVKERFYDYNGYSVNINMETVEKIYSRMLDAVCEYPAPEGKTILKAIEDDKLILFRKYEDRRQLDEQEQASVDNYIRFFARTYRMQFDQAASYLGKIITLQKNYRDAANKITDVWKDITGGASESAEENYAYRKYEDAKLTIDQLPNYEPNPHGV